MYRYICLFFMLNFIYSGFKVGMDFNSEVELSSSGYYSSSIDYDLDNGFSIGFETLRGNGISFAIDYLMKTELEGAGGVEASLISVYALYPFYNSTSENSPQVVVSGMLGYSIPDLSYDGDSTELDADGGLMYGIEALFNNHFSVAMTFHNGELSPSYDYDYYYGYDMSVDFDVSRFTLSYIF